MNNQIEPNTRQTAASLSQFLFDSPTPFHAVAQTKQSLLEAGFKPLFEEDSWEILRRSQPGQGFFCTRGGSLIAWLQGPQAPWQSGLNLAGAHTDSPCLKLKLESAALEYGVLTAHVSIYGSPIFAAHTDRSLNAAGIAVHPNRPDAVRYIYTAKPVAIVPNLAIHLNREANTKLAYNAQTQLKAVFGPHNETDANGTKILAQKLLRQKLGLGEDEICDIQLCNGHKAQQIGLPTGAQNQNNGELFSGARLDDMSMVYLLLEELRQLRQSGKKPQRWPVAIFCNGEEIGSRTYEGADSNFVSSVLQRIVRNSGAEAAKTAHHAECGEHGAHGPHGERWAQTQARSFFLSLDGAHASHPCYPEAFDPHYKINMGGGPALKLPNGASYSSEPFSIARIQAVAARSGCRLQIAAPRSDMPTGSTIGPILSSGLGVRGVDIGLPMYAMHSIQETISLQDYLSLQGLVREYYED